jgi:transcriptional regulator with XRE-family HTH domain
MTGDRVKQTKKTGRSLKEKKKEGGRLSATLDEGLRSYTIGDRLRALRLKKKMGLVELGQHTGLSPALLSKLERGRLFPTLPTLLRIALVFSVDLQYFFAGPRERPVIAVVRKKDRIRLPDDPAGKDVSYLFESLDFPVAERKLHAYLAEFQALAEDRMRLHAHPGAELILVLNGALHLRVGEENHVLEAGDSIYFDAAIPHAYRRHDRPPCTAVVVTTG